MVHHYLGSHLLCLFDTDPVVSVFANNTPN
jgi:hypothetical protein